MIDNRDEEIKQKIKEARKDEKKKIKKRLITRFEMEATRHQFLSVGTVIHRIKEVIK